LYQGYNVTLTNYGNVENKEKFTYNLGFLELLATKSDPMGIQTANGLDYTVSLSPGESLTISIVTDFRRPFYTSLICLVVLLLLLALYLRFRSPVVVSKNAVVIGEKDGGTSEVKVIVNVKNRSGHVVENIAILDKIPGITEIEQEFSLGTLKPRKIVRHPKKGTLILWDFPTMEPYEERVITYRIHSKIGILGHMRLPSAVVKFMTNDGRTMTYRSPKMKKDN
jgi:hypothetical protein